MALGARPRRLTTVTTKERPPHVMAVIATCLRVSVACARGQFVLRASNSLRHWRRDEFVFVEGSFFFYRV